MSRELGGEGSRIESWEKMLSLGSLESSPSVAFNFAVTADPHCVETPASVRPGRGLEHVGDGAARFRLCFDALRRLDDPTDFVLLLGDIELDRAAETLAGAPCPIHAVAGNHEWGEGRARLRGPFPEDFGEAVDA